MKLEIHSKVKDGRLVANRAALSRSLADYEGKEVIISIRERKNTRSNLQNAYYWAAVVPIVRDAMRDAGHRLTIEEMHLMLRAKFLNEPLHLGDGTFIDQIRSTTSLTKSEFSNYIEDIREWCLEYLNTDIPEANTQTELQWSE